MTETAPSSLNPKIVQTTCPDCGVPYDCEIWHVISNVALPDVTHQLMSGSLFEMICPICGHMDFIAYRCLYHDIPHQTLVLLEPNSDKHDAAVRVLRKKVEGSTVGGTDVVGGDGNDEVGGSDAASGDDEVGGADVVGDDGDNPLSGRSDSEPSVRTARLVTDPDRLSEKARILDADLDDKAIEVLKAFIHEQLIREDELFEPSQFFFDGEDFTGNLLIEVSGYEDGAVFALRSLYDSIASSLPENAEDTVVDFTVDQKWAYSFLENNVQSEADSILMDDWEKSNQRGFSWHDAPGEMPF